MYVSYLPPRFRRDAFYFCVVAYYSSSLSCAPSLTGPRGASPSLHELNFAEGPADWRERRDAARFYKHQNGAAAAAAAAGAAGAEGRQAIDHNGGYDDIDGDNDDDNFSVAYDSRKKTERGSIEVLRAGGEPNPLPGDEREKTREGQSFAGGNMQRV